jgi:ketosteroid isomerase-like protein
MDANEALLRKSYEALERGDWEALGNMLAEDFVLAVAGRNPLAGETRGRDANIARQQRLIKLLGGRPYHTEHIDTAVSDDRVFDYARVTYDLGGKSFSYTTVNVWRIEDGKFKEVRGHIFDLYAWDDLWAEIAASSKPAAT